MTVSLNTVYCRLDRFFFILLGFCPFYVYYFLLCLLQLVKPCIFVCTLRSICHLRIKIIIEIKPFPRIVHSTIIQYNRHLIIIIQYCYCLTLNNAYVYEHSTLNIFIFLAAAMSKMDVRLKSVHIAKLGVNMREPFNNEKCYH